MAHPDHDDDKELVDVLAASRTSASEDVDFALALEASRASAAEERQAQQMMESTGAEGVSAEPHDELGQELDGDLATALAASRASEAAEETMRRWRQELKRTFAPPPRRNPGAEAAQSGGDCDGGESDEELVAALAASRASAEDDRSRREQQHVNEEDAELAAALAASRALAAQEGDHECDELTAALEVSRAFAEEEKLSGDCMVSISELGEAPDAKEQNQQEDAQVPQPQADFPKSDMPVVEPQAQVEVTLNTKADFASITSSEEVAGEGGSAQVADTAPIFQESPVPPIATAIAGAVAAVSSRENTEKALYTVEVSSAFKSQQEQTDQSDSFGDSAIANGSDEDEDEWEVVEWSP